MILNKVGDKASFGIADKPPKIVTMRSRAVARKVVRSNNKGVELESAGFLRDVIDGAESQRSCSLEAGGIKRMCCETLSLVGKAILFDMDGTLVDSTRMVERAWERWATRYGFPLGEVLSFSHGRPTAATLEHFLPGRDHAADLGEMMRFHETETEGVVPVPGAAQVLEVLQLQKCPWAIVTSAWRTLATKRIVFTGLPLPAVLVSADQVRNGKPDPEGFLLAARQLGIAPVDCIVFEDTYPGINAGLSAGMQVVGLRTTFSAENLKHSPSVADFRDVKIWRRGQDLEVVLTGS